MTTDPGDDRPHWARRIRAERVARNWSQADAVRALTATGGPQLPDHAALLDQWKRWETGKVRPGDFYQPLIARTFGVPTAAVFPQPGRRDADAALLANTGMDTLELVARLRASDVSQATFDALQINADRLCAEYSHLPAGQLHVEGQAWLGRITSLLDRRLTLGQHREVLTLAGWVALLVGCLEYDMGDRRSAEATRRAALQLGDEAGHAEIVGWAHEMRAWYALTQGNLRGAVASADAGLAVVGEHRGVAVQLAAHRAKAWARMGDRREVEVTLDRGRAMLEAMPYPDDLDNHFVIDPSKFDFYTMDAYRWVGEDRLAETYAQEVIRSSTDAAGEVVKPMRVSEARITLGVVAARAGDLDGALEHGAGALGVPRRSLPSLLMNGRELGHVLRDRFPGDGRVEGYAEELRALAS